MTQYWGSDLDSQVPVLRTKRLVLRSPDERDIPAWFARATDREAAALAGDPIPADIAEGAEWLARSRRRAAAGERLLWSIDYPHGADSIGTISLSMPTPTLAFVLGRAHWGQGLATEAAREVLRFAFHRLQVSEVQAEAVVRNSASLRVLAKLGFRPAESRIDETDGEECVRLVRIDG